MTVTARNARGHMSDYRALIARKAVTATPAGMEIIPDLNSHLFPFQRELTERALRRGRSALFASTGLGKTLMQLSWAAAVARETRKPVLDLTPLAVAEQTVEEAEAFDIEGVEYCPDGAGGLPMIPVTNYDRLDHFDLSQFGGVVLDESSILKAHDGKTRKTLTALCQDIPFRLCCSATPAPNDYVELGQHAEFLGVMSAKEMLATWFVHDGSSKATNVANKGKAVAEWRLKGHAEADFWRWVASWATLVRKPSDLGYDDAGYELPPLRKHQITVPVEHRPADGMLFQMQANTLQERLQARRDSIEGRCRAVAELVHAYPDRQWLIWCHLNKEEERLCELIPDLIPVRGTDDRDVKRQRLLGFGKGNIARMVTKPSVAGFGMNWQSCHTTAFVGLNDSFEQIYQALRRFWRFGQKAPVDAYFVASELEGAVVANQQAKEEAYERMSEALVAHVRDYQRPAPRVRAATKKMGVPEWLM